MDTYIFIIGICLIVIVSFFFNVLSDKTHIPSVMLLIVLGMVIRQFVDHSSFESVYMPILEMLGVIGLIMIVLEAALDLKLTPDRWPVIWKSFLVAFISLNLTVMGLAFMFKFTIQELDLTTAVIYAIPLSIMSSAVVIPSVNKLIQFKREFMIYESTFSDIIGIMAFYILLENTNTSGVGEVVVNVAGNLGLTIIVSLLGSYVMLYIFQKLVYIHTKYFLFLSMLILLYVLGKTFHLSALLIILVFGLVLRNQFIFLRGSLRKFYEPLAINSLFSSFKMITEETSFLIRTFFFVLFGMAIKIESVLQTETLLFSLIFLAGMYLIRFVIFRAVVGKDIFPETFLAPRGLISVLLFFAIPDDFVIPEIETGILFVVILVTSAVMGWSLLKWSPKRQTADVESSAGAVQNKMAK